MTVLLIKLLLGGAVAFLTVLASERWHKRSAYVSAVVGSVGAVLIASAADAVGVWYSDPAPIISSQMNKGEAVITIEAQKHTASLAIDMPILGRIVNIHDYNSPADALIVRKGYLGANLPDSLNYAEIVLHDLKPHRNLSFRILYEPTKSDATNADRWRLSYSWDYGGLTLDKTKCYLAETGWKVAPPCDTPVATFAMFDRAMSEDEIKERFKQGPPRTDIR